jgi:hypothetical protein
MKQQLVLILTAAFATVTLPSAFAADTDLTALGPSSSFIESSSIQSSQGDYVRTAAAPGFAAAQARSNTAWKISRAVVASEAMDALSSRGLHELNPLLANSEGQFGAKATLLKIGFTGALLGMEYIVMRSHPGAAKVFWKINVISAAVTGGVAAHNLSLH